MHHLYVAQTGIGSYMKDLAKWVKSDAPKTHDYTLYPADIEKLLKPNYRRKPWVLFRVMAQLELLLWKQLIIPIKVFFTKPDILFSPDYYSPVLPLKCKKVTVFYDTFFWDSPEHYGGLWLKYFKWIINKGLGKDGQILTISDYSKIKLINKLNIENSRVTSLHLPINLEREEELKNDAWLQELGVSCNFFLHVGVFEKRKQLPFLVKSFANWLDSSKEEFQLILVGKRAPNSRFDDYDEVQSLVEKLGLTGKVLFPGFISNSQLDQLYARAFGYILPSINEGFGLPVLESFLRKCPLIISSQGAIVEVAGSAALVFQMQDQESLIKKMNLIVSDEKLRSDLILKGEERLALFTLQTYFDKFENYLSKVIMNDKNE